MTTGRVHSDWIPLYQWCGIALHASWGRSFSRRVFRLKSCLNDYIGVLWFTGDSGTQSITRLFSDQALENIKNPRLFNFKERTLMFKFWIKHRPGKFNAAPDCASRYPADTPSENTREDDCASAAQTQQGSIHKPLKTVMVYPAQTIDSAVKAAFMSMYESDP